MILLFTDFGSADIYVGQMKAALLQRVPEARIVDLMHDVPAFNIHAGAHLLAALAGHVPQDAVMLCVVDPGVGSFRRAVVMEADGRSYVGPDNGLFSVIAQRSNNVRYWEIEWRPDDLSSTFHGRDLFAPIAAMLEMRSLPEEALSAIPSLAVMLDVADQGRIIHIDHYGNAISDIPAGAIEQSSMLKFRDYHLSHGAYFAQISPGVPFWYENSIGLVEIAVNSGSAAKHLGIAVGDLLQFYPG